MEGQLQCDLRDTFPDRLDKVWLPAPITVLGPGFIACRPVHLLLPPTQTPECKFCESVDLVSLVYLLLSLEWSELPNLLHVIVGKKITCLVEQVGPGVRALKVLSLPETCDSSFDSIKHQYHLPNYITQKT